MFAEAMKQPLRVLPVNTPVIIETQAFVYFNADEPLEIDPIVLSGDEADLRNAIQALAPLLSDADRAKYRHIINPKMSKSLLQRYRDWKDRNGQS